MTKSVLTRRELEAVGKMLSANHGITLSIGGTKCCTDGKHIYLPDIPEELSNERLVDILRYFLDHECGHIIGKSDISELDKIINELGPGAGETVAQVCEDVRVEDLMSHIWYGCGINLHRGAGHLMKSIGEKADPSKGVPLTGQVMAYIYATGRKLAMPDWIQSEVRVALEPMASEIASIPDRSRCTADAMDTARRCYEKVKHLFDDPEPPPENREQAEQEQPEQEKPEQEQEQEKPEGESEQEQESPEGESESESEQEKEQEKEQPKDAQPASMSATATEEIASQMEQTGATECIMESGRLLVLAPEDYQTGGFFRLPPPDARRYLRQCHISQSDYASAVSASGGTMRQYILRLLLTEEKTWYRSGLRRGMPDPARMAMLASRLGTDVMRKRHERSVPRTAVAIAVDASGSMIRTRIAANIAAGAFADILGMAGHKVCVYGFYSAPPRLGVNIHDPEDHVVLNVLPQSRAVITDKWSPYWMPRKKEWIWRNKGGSTSEMHNSSPIGSHADHTPDRTPLPVDTVLLRVKDWHERYQNTVKNFTYAANYFDVAGTPTGHVVAELSRMLLARPERRKILLVMTDGQPNDRAHARKAFTWAEQCGIEASVIGIHHMVSHLHHRAADNINPTNLSKEGIKALIDCLKPAGMAR